LEALPAESIDCIVTSPPYWQLQDYGVSGQLGMEPTIEQYIEELCGIFDKVKRVLKLHGTCWVNLGDRYASNGLRNKGFNARWHSRRFNSDKQAAADKVRPSRRLSGLPEKSLVLMPFRFAIEMVRRGWILRNTLIWHKPNCLPASVKDRFTIDFEFLFFFVKAKGYFFQRQFEPHQASTKRRVRSFHENKEHFDPTRHKHAPGDVSEAPFAILERICSKGLDPRGRNKRCVWTIAVQGFRGDHFATFPEELVETPIKAGCPVGGVVCDPFFGTGTTGLVARKLDRHFIGVELSPRYIKIARQRIASMTSGEKYD
jgi:DNA modification methylase